MEETLTCSGFLGKWHPPGAQESKRRLPKSFTVLQTGGLRARGTGRGFVLRGDRSPLSAVRYSHFPAASRSSTEEMKHSCKNGLKSRIEISPFHVM